MTTPKRNTAKEYLGWSDQEVEDMLARGITNQLLNDEYVLGKFNVLWVIDDRDRVVRMWRGLGLTCLQVAEGAF